MDRALLAERPISSSGGIYPFADLDPALGYPAAADFEIVQTADNRGFGVRARKTFRRGEMVCRVSGYVVAERRLHTLQITANSHLFDPHFTGLLLHSCDPNVFWTWRNSSCGRSRTSPPPIC